MTSATSSAALDHYTLEQLSKHPPLAAAEAEALHKWWQRDGEAGELFPQFLARQEILIPDAVDTLRMMQKGYLSFADNQHLFTKQGLAAVEELREVSRSFSLHEDSQFIQEDNNAEKATQAMDLEPTELELAQVTRPQKEPSTVMRSAPAETKSKVLAWAQRTLQADWEQTGPLSNQVVGAFQIGSLLGSGPWGSIYHAVDLVHQREVALKVLDRELASHEAATHFLHCSRLAMRSQHPNLVRVYSANQEGESLFQARQYLKCRNLEQRLALEGALPMSEVWQLARQACSILEYVHQAGEAHHNLKPTNWWFDQGRLLLSDLGLLSPDHSTAVPPEHSRLVELRQLTLCMYLMATAQVTTSKAFSIARQTQFHDPTAMQSAGMDLSRVPSALAEVIHRIWSISQPGQAPTLETLAEELRHREATHDEPLPQFSDEDFTHEGSTLGLEVSSLSIGSWLGKCLITERIGEGSTCEVFRAVHRTLNVPVALKVIQPELLDSDPSVVQTFSTEAKLLARLAHPNVVRVIDYEDEATPPYLVMEYVEGWSLAELIEQTGRLQLDRVIGILGQVVRGLEAASQLGLVHGDLNPANILLTKDGTAKIADFGLATLSQPNTPEGSAGQDWQVGAGTPAYMAPEQIEPTGNPLDCRADIYALGCTFYHAVTGNLPFEGSSPMEVWLKHLRSEVPQKPLADLPKEVAQTIKKMLAKAPEQRQQTYAELIADFERCLQSPGRSSPSWLGGWLKGK